MIIEQSRGVYDRSRRDFLAVGSPGGQAEWDNDDGPVVGRKSGEAYAVFRVLGRPTPSGLSRPRHASVVTFVIGGGGCARNEFRAANLTFCAVSITRRRIRVHAVVDRLPLSEKIDRSIASISRGRTKIV